MGQQYPKMQRDYELEEWKNKAESRLKIIYSLISLLAFVAVGCGIIFFVVEPQKNSSNQVKANTSVPIAKSTLLEPKQVLVETKSEDAVQPPKTVADFEKQYQRPSGCDNPANMSIMIECSNHYIRARDKFFKQ